MLKIQIPSFENLDIENVVFDYNGTIAKNGDIQEHTMKKLEELSNLVNVYVVTADTYKTVEKNIKNMNIKLEIISKENGAEDKFEFVKSLNANKTIAVGNGHNDLKMIQAAKLGICILETEGCFTKTLLNSDVVFKNIDDFIDSLLNTSRLIATTRG